MRRSGASLRSMGRGLGERRFLGCTVEVRHSYTSSGRIDNDTEVEEVETERERERDGPDVPSAVALVGSGDRPSALRV